MFTKLRANIMQNVLITLPIISLAINSLRTPEPCFLQSSGQTLTRPDSSKTTIPHPPDAVSFSLDSPSSSTSVTKGRVSPRILLSARHPQTAWRRWQLLFSSTRYVSHTTASRRERTFPYQSEPLRLKWMRVMKAERKKKCQTEREVPLHSRRMSTYHWQPIDWRYIFHNDIMNKSTCA